MTSRNIFDAMRSIDAQFILDAAPAEKAKKKNALRKRLLKWGSLAAGLVILLSIAAVWIMPDTSSDSPKQPDFPPYELPEGSYFTMSSDWQVYNSAEELINSADLVLIGKITDIDFQVLDSSNALPVSDTTPEYFRQLYTVYTVDISQTYKGNPEAVSTIRVPGGMVDFAVERQLEVMEEGKAFSRENGIPILENYHKVQCSIGNSYLFVLRQFDTGAPTILNIDQSVFDLHDPARKQTIGNNPNIYHSGDKDEYNLPLISAKDVISEFGNAEWKEFNEKWAQGVYAPPQ